MRALIALALVSAGCNQLLGITDPTPGGGGGDAGADALADSSVDAAPPCTTSLTFKPATTFDLGATGRDLVVGNFDNGGVDDVAIAVGTAVLVFHGDGAGGFGGDGERIVVPTAADALVAADFDIDGDDDLAMWTVGGSSVVVRRQDRTLDPPFRDEQPLTGPFTALRRAFVGQLDGALVPDLLVNDGTGSRRYTASLGTPGTFARDMALVGGAGDELVVVRQIDGAQRDDAVFVNAGAVKLSLLTTTFGTPTEIATDATGRGVAFGNFDTDTIVDLVVATPAGLVLYRQHPTQRGTFTNAGVISSLTADALEVADVNGDGRDDLVLPTGVLLQCAPPGPDLPGVFTQFEGLDAAPPRVLRDVTGDGKLDLLRLVGTVLEVRVQ